MNDNFSLWEDFLNPSILRPRLIAVSVYIAAFEILKVTIVDRIRDFFTNGFDENGWRVSPKYQSDVLARNSSPLYASLEWLKDARAINADDIAMLDRAKNVRNELAHKLSEKLFEGLPSDFGNHFGDMVSLLDKIERWWVVNVEIATSPELHDAEIDEQSIIPGPVMGLRLMLEIALGSEEESSRYLAEFKKRKPKP